MSLRDTAPGATNTPSDESYKRLIPSPKSGIEIPDLPTPGKGDTGGMILFRWFATAENHIRHGMKFWLQTGATKTNGEMISVPFVSARPFEDFVIAGRKGKFVGRSAAEKGCVLSKLADQRHPVVALNTLRKDEKTGLAKPQVDPFHTIHAQIVELEKDAGGATKKGPDGKPLVKVLPTAYGFEFRQGWWDQFVNLLEPLPVDDTPVDDTVTDQPAKKPPKDLKAFMEANKLRLDQVVFYIQKVRRTEKKSTNESMNVDYFVSFSEKLWITDAVDVKAEDPLDWAKAYMVPTQEEIDNLVMKAENRNKSADGAHVPAPAAGGGTKAPSADDPGAYKAPAQTPGLGGDHVPLDETPPAGDGGEGGNPWD